MAVAGFQQAIHPFPFVAQENQALRVLVEPSDRKDFLGEPKPGEGPLTRLVGRELTEDAVGLVEGDQHRDLPRFK